MTRNFYGRTKTPRTRTGCLTCRDRKVKCGEERPRCRRCRDGGRACEYGLKINWTGPGRAARCKVEDEQPPLMQRQLSTCIAALHQAMFLNTTYDDFRILAGGSTQETRDTVPLGRPASRQLRKATLPLLHHQPSISPKYPPSRVPHIDRFIFSYYANNMCTKCALLDGNSNPYRRVIIQISFHSQLVLQSCLAAAANQIRHHHSSYSEAALKHRGSCLRSLHRQIAFLSSGQISTMVATKTEILGAILMLCFFDYFNTRFRESLSRKTQSGWTVHLHGARKILELTTTLGSPQCDQAISSFLGHHLAAQSVLSYATIADSTEGEALLSGGRYWLLRTVRPAWEINSFAGCSNELLDILLDIIERIRHRDSPREGQGTTWEMRERLTRLVQLAPTTSPKCGTAEGGQMKSQKTEESPRAESSTMSLDIAEAFRQAAILLFQYLQCDTDSRQTSRIQECASAIMSSLPQVSKHPKVVQGHSVFLWPYFIGACHIVEDAKRATIMTTFQTLAETTDNLRSVAPPMLELIESVWKQLDLQDGDLGAQSGDEPGGRAFAWEKVLRGRGWSLNWS